MNYNLITKIINSYGFTYKTDFNNSFSSIPVGIGDLLFKLTYLQQGLIKKPVYINIDIFISGLLKFHEGDNPIIWFSEPYNNFIFRIKMLNDICENNNYICKNDIIFFSTNNYSVLEKYTVNFNYRQLNEFVLKVNPNFFIDTFEENIINFIKSPFIIIHTKLRLNSSYNYKKIKFNLKNFFTYLQINAFNVIIMGEKTFPTNYESNVHGITTIYDEVMELKKLNSNKILDISEECIYNSLNYERYKHDISLINKATYNISFGQGGSLCSSLLFGKCIFFDPIDAKHFYRNNKLFNSGHRYFKNLEPMLQYLKEILN